MTRRRGPGKRDEGRGAASGPRGGVAGARLLLEELRGDEALLALDAQAARRAVLRALEDRLELGVEGAERVAVRREGTPGDGVLVGLARRGRAARPGLPRPLVRRSAPLRQLRARVRGRPPREAEVAMGALDVAARHAPAPAQEGLEERVVGEALEQAR